MATLLGHAYGPYGLDRPGNYVKKTMKDCTGEEITQERRYHMAAPLEEFGELAVHSVDCKPCMMPYITAFVLRWRGGRWRTAVVPLKGPVTFGFLGQFAGSWPQDIIFTSGYSARTAMEAVYTQRDIEPGGTESHGAYSTGWARQVVQYGSGASARSRRCKLAHREDAATMSTSARAAQLSVSGYLDRIGLGDGMRADDLEPTLHVLRALHEAHMLAVPFENLSIHYGQPIILEEAALYDKIVRRRRGGFCFELNGLFAWLLRQVGFDVTLLSARVAEPDGDFSPAFDHLTLLLHQVDGTDWLADVGFGDSFRQPLQLRPDTEQDGADGRLYRLRRVGEEDGHPTERQKPRRYPWVLQQHVDTAAQRWEPQYQFTVQPRALSDFAERCHYHQTSPESHFTQKRICSLSLPHGRVSVSDLRLITTLDGEREERLLRTEEEYRAVLAERFGIDLPAERPPHC